MDEYFYCPLDDGDDFPGSTNCGGEDFGSRLALDVHFMQAHGGMEPPVRLALQGSAHPSHESDYASAMCALRPFVASENPDFHGAPVTPHTGGWGQLGAGAGIGQGLPQARYVIWSQGTPIAWYLNDRTDQGWVFPEGDYYKYDRITSRHQSKIGAALKMMQAEEIDTTWPAPWLAAYERIWS
jgi:hypothetical protein